MFLSKIGSCSCKGLYVDPPHSVPPLCVCYSLPVAAARCCFCCSGDFILILDMVRVHVHHSSFPPRVCLLDYSLSDLCEVGLKVVLVCLSLVAKSVEHSLEYLLPIYRSVRTI